MFSLASTYCAESGRSKIPADNATASATIGHLARTKLRDGAFRVYACAWMMLPPQLRSINGSSRCCTPTTSCPSRTGTCSRASGTCATIRTRAPGVTQVTDNIYGIYRVTTRLATRKASSLITFTVRLMESLETTRQLFSPRLVRLLSGVDHTTRPVKISDSHMFRRAAWLVPLVLVSACAPARRMPARVPTSAEIHVVIIQSPAINAVTRLGDRTGECPALTIGVTEGMFRQLSLDICCALPWRTSSATWSDGKVECRHRTDGRRLLPPHDAPNGCRADGDASARGARVQAPPTALGSREFQVKA